MIRNILFDFDGVIINSIDIREKGYREIFEGEDENLVEKLLKYNLENGGSSRYVKIRYFYEVLLQKNISEKEVIKLSDKFTSIMKKELINKEYLIEETIKFINKIYKKFNIHIVSGADEKELKFICNKLEIDKYFISIYGSPRKKEQNLKELIKNYNYKIDETIYIGDSINDYEAAKENNLNFFGYNNKELINISKVYLNNYSYFDFMINQQFDK